MKTLTNNTKQILKSTAAFALAFCITIGSAFATTTGNDTSKDSSKIKKEVSVEEEAMINELLAEMEKAEELDFMIENFQTNKVTFEIYNNADKLIFSGTQKQWDDKTNKDLIEMKRKAEFLMDADGTNIYKVF